MGQKTVLYNEHLALGGKMVEFGGWEMPVQYSGIVDEHNTVRNSVGLFDVSHMGQVFVSGDDSINFLQKIVPQDISKLPINKAEYCQLPNKNGGLIDDLIIYRLADKEFLIIVNASRIENDTKWFEENKDGFNVVLDNRSKEFSMLALQGSDAGRIIEKLGITKDKQPLFFRIQKTKINQISIYLAKTGYTGEDGFEIMVKNECASTIWNLILEAGKEFDIKPIGLGARDTLRLEAALMLYGNDLNEEITPVEAKLGWSIPKDKIEDYNGKSVIMNQLEHGTEKTLIGFEMLERAIPRHGYEIYYEGQKTGFVSSGGYSPTLNKNIGLGYVETNKKIKLDATIQIMVRNKLYNAKVIKRPFVEKKYKSRD